VLEVRTTWTIGAGPTLVQVPPRALPLWLSLSIKEDFWLALSRSEAACSMLSWVSPESSRLA